MYDVLLHHLEGGSAAGSLSPGAVGNAAEPLESFLDIQARMELVE